MRFYKLISIVLHPIMVPTLGVLAYFSFIPQTANKELQIRVLGAIFILTYVIPLLILTLLKKLKYIKDFQVSTIRERRFPVLVMIALFYFFGNVLIRVPSTRELGTLFYGTSLSLGILYIFFSVALKSSLHLISMGNAIGFFLTLAYTWNLSVLPIIVSLVLTTGFLASARLNLKAHSPLELLVGLFLGLVSQFIVFYAL